MIRRFVTNVDPVALATAAEALSGHGVVVEHVADDPTGLRHLDVIEPETAQNGHST